ncbi:MAG TPA: hypothetical protein VFB13_17920 [Reyranella sp.]|nr:hypothetical protein [Reyranella sp.]
MSFWWQAFGWGFGAGAVGAVVAIVALIFFGVLGGKLPGPN